MRRSRSGSRTAASRSSSASPEDGGGGRLAGGIAPDFKTYYGDHGYSPLISTRQAGDPTRPDGRRSPGRGARAALTRQLLAFSRKQILAPTVLNLNRSVLRDGVGCSGGLIGRISSSCLLEPQLASVMAIRARSNK